MEVDERPTEQYADIGGLDKQIQEVSVSFLFLFLWNTNFFWPLFRLFVINRSNG